jgi:hypothetical protein
MRRLYTIVQSFCANSVDGEAREFKPGAALWQDLEQSGDEFKFETAARLEWFVDRRTFEQCCVLTDGPDRNPPGSLCDDSVYG